MSFSRRFVLTDFHRSKVIYGTAGSTVVLLALGTLVTQDVRRVRHGATGAQGGCYHRSLD